MKKLFVVFLIAIVFRILLIPVARHGDINNNASWGKLLLERGTQGFYERTEWPYSPPNQPPLYLYLFGTASFLQNASTNTIVSLNKNLSFFPSRIVWINEEWGELFWMKMPSILSDIGIAYVIYLFIKEKKNKAVILSAIWLFNPITWYNSAIWGGTDSIVNLIGIVSLYYLFKKDVPFALLFFSMSVLFKGSLALWFPFLLLVAIYQRHSLKTYFRSVLFSLSAVLLLSAPFHLSFDLPLWLANLYTQRFFPGEVGSLTANAFNFWWLVDAGKTLDSTVFFGVSARVWGIMITSICYIYACLKYMKNPNRTVNSAIISLSIISFAVFLFMTRIHERYLYPFYPLATLSLISPSMWVPYILVSITGLLNLYHLFWAPSIPLVEAWYLNPVFMFALSFINICIFGLFLYASSRKVKEVSS